MWKAQEKNKLFSKSLKKIVQHPKSSLLQLLQPGKKHQTKTALVEEVRKRSPELEQKKSKTKED